MSMAVLRTSELLKTFVPTTLRSRLLHDGPSGLTGKIELEKVLPAIGQKSTARNCRGRADGAIVGESRRVHSGTVTRSQRAFQNHREMKIAGEYKKQQMTFPAGTIIVRTAQPLGRLVCYLLEPESDDGLVNWNFFDPDLETGKTFPVYKLMQNVNAASRLMSETRP
jgi:hypothetical protein